MVNCFRNRHPAAQRYVLIWFVILLCCLSLHKYHFAFSLKLHSVEISLFRMHYKPRKGLINNFSIVGHFSLSFRFPVSRIHFIPKNEPASPVIHKVDCSDIYADTLKINYFLYLTGNCRHRCCKGGL